MADGAGRTGFARVGRGVVVSWTNALVLVVTIADAIKERRYDDAQAARRELDAECWRHNHGASYPPPVREALRELGLGETFRPMAQPVRVYVSPVGQSFACAGLVRHALTGETLAETEVRSGGMRLRPASDGQEQGDRDHVSR